jgi:sugar lactone lactonase YvrE
MIPKPAMAEAVLVLAAGAQLGEGPCWDARQGVLWWVDIDAFALHRYDPATDRDATFPVGQPVSAVVPRNRGGLVLALKEGLAAFEPGAGAMEVLVQIEPDREDTRLNDATCDSRGRLWVGTLDARITDLGVPSLGSLYRFDPDLSLTRMIDHVGCSNGIDWSPDDRYMYFVDTELQRVDVFDFEAETGAIDGRRTLVDIPFSSGAPDGLTVDAEGFVWVALWGKGRIHRYDPAGVLDQVVQVGAHQVTSCAFGGPQLSDLYVTSAADASSYGGLGFHPGGLFRCRPGVSGRPPHGFGG